MTKHFIETEAGHILVGIGRTALTPLYNGYLLLDLMYNAPHKYLWAKYNSKALALLLNKNKDIKWLESSCKLMIEMKIFRDERPSNHEDLSDLIMQTLSNEIDKNRSTPRTEFFEDTNVNGCSSTSNSEHSGTSDVVCETAEENKKISA